MVPLTPLGGSPGNLTGGIAGVQAPIAGFFVAPGMAMRRHPAVALGGALLAAMMLTALLAPWLGTVDPQQIAPATRLRPPSAAWWFGTDMLGRDVYSRTLFGARVSLIVGISVAVVSIVAGTALGILAGFFRAVDAVLMRLLDGLMAIPAVLLAISLISLTGASMSNVIVAISVAEAPRVARLVRSLVLSLRVLPYVEAAVACGTRTPMILWRHILPGTLAPLMVQGTYIFASAILTEAILSFIGAGTPPNIPSWGNIMAEGRSVYQIAPSIILFPGICLSLTVLAVNLLGDGMRDALDPRLDRKARANIRAASTAAPVTAADGMRGVAAHRVPMGTAPLLAVEDLDTRFFAGDSTVRAVNGVSFSVFPGETVAVVGESGCGKSVTALSILRLLPMPPACVVSGQVRFRGIDLLGLQPRAIRRIRGREIGMVFQEPMTALNPVLTVGRQCAEILVRHQGLPRRAAREQVIGMFRLVHIPEPARRVREYPHQLSGGMRQRVMIAMAMACNPALLIADEPTTALDVTIQAQILDLMREMKERFGSAIILITHDLGVVAEMAQQVVVMYAGRKVEEAPVTELFRQPLHPYTRALIGSVPRLGATLSGPQRLVEIPGLVPSMREAITGCAFAPRCPLATDRCRAETPALEEKRSGHVAACHHSDVLAPFPEPP